MRIIRSKVRLLALLAVIIVGLVVAGPAGFAPGEPRSAEAEILSEVKKLLAGDAEASDNFGHSVAVSGDTAVVGAFWEDAGGNDAGATYVLQRDRGGADNWGEVKKLLASDAQADDWFGQSVAVSGDTAVVGAYWEDAGGNDAGAAYVFARDRDGADNWGEVKKLTASDAQAGDNFGVKVSVSGDTAVVGAWLEDAGGSSAGAAYVFEREEGGADNWGEVKKLTASDAEAGDEFGGSVAISADTAVVGAGQEDAAGNDAGAAYVFGRDEGGTDNWGQVERLRAADTEAGDYFGVSVAVSGDTAVVGASGEEDGGSLAGAAYVFGRDEGGPNTWGEVKKLTASDAGAGDVFGISVAVSGDTALVGAYWEDAGGENAGAAYVFLRDHGGAGNWGEVRKLLASDSEAGDAFGSSVAVSGNTAVVGAGYEDEGASNAGAAYVFQEPPTVQQTIKLVNNTTNTADFVEVLFSGPAVTAVSVTSQPAGCPPATTYSEFFLVDIGWATGCVQKGDVVVLKLTVKNPPGAVDVVAVEWYNAHAGALTQLDNSVSCTDIYLGAPNEKGGEPPQGAPRIGQSLTRLDVDGHGSPLSGVTVTYLGPDTNDDLIPDKPPTNADCGESFISAQAAPERGTMNPSVKFAAVTNYRPGGPPDVVKKDGLYSPMGAEDGDFLWSCSDGQDNGADTVADKDDPDCYEDGVVTLRSDGCAFSEGLGIWIRQTTNSVIQDTGWMAINYGEATLYLGTDSPANTIDLDGDGAGDVAADPAECSGGIPFPSTLVGVTRNAATDHPEENLARQPLVVSQIGPAGPFGEKDYELFDAKANPSPNLWDHVELHIGMPDGEPVAAVVTFTCQKTQEVVPGVLRAHKYLINDDPLTRDHEVWVADFSQKCFGGAGSPLSVYIVPHDPVDVVVKVAYAGNTSEPVIGLDPDGPYPKVAGVPQNPDTMDGWADDWDGDGCPDWDELDPWFVNGRDPFNPEDCDQNFNGVFNILVTVEPATKDGNGDVVPGTYFHCISRIDHAKTAVYEYIDQSITTSDAIDGTTDPVVFMVWRGDKNLQPGDMIKIDDEQMLVTNYDKGIFTLDTVLAQRAQKGTQIAPHQVGAPVLKKIGVTTPANSLDVNLVCYQDSQGWSGDSAVPSHSDGLAGAPPPPPYTGAAPVKLQGTYDPGTQTLAFTGCFPNQGPPLGPNVIWDATLDAKTMKGSLDIFGIADDNECAAKSGGFQPITAALQMTEQKDGFDHDGDGCSDWDELGHDKIPPTVAKCGDDPYNPYDSPNQAGDVSGSYSSLWIVNGNGGKHAKAPSGGLPGSYFNCVLEINHDTTFNTVAAPIYCYTDIVELDDLGDGDPNNDTLVAVAVNYEDSGLESCPPVPVGTAVDTTKCGDGQPGPNPPGPAGPTAKTWGDVDDPPMTLLGLYNKQTNLIQLAGCFQDVENPAQGPSIYVQVAIPAHAGDGVVQIYLRQDPGDCKAGTPDPSPDGQGERYVQDVPLESGRQSDATGVWDTDQDGCTNAQELASGPGSQTTGGLRDPYNYWDFRDVPSGTPPVRDGAVSVGDISAVVGVFGTSGTATLDPVNTAVTAGYHTAYDTGGGIIGSAGVWNVRGPDGAISVGDITAIVNQFGHSC